ncbi:hypothetical protein R3P38DRAFT_3211634 [Favolaschia claudopus]|uniref:Uncharacterized protein n=1 Tax=Favolaschia claudopus TaxID=2862362 RepID=A0AAW0AF66_9AGAR
MRRFTARRQARRPRPTVSFAPISISSPAPVSISLNADIWLEVARLSNRNDQLSLCRVSQQVYLTSRFLIYQNVYVRGSAANALVDTLDKKTVLAPIVERLLFADDDAFVDIAQWERVIVQLTNLRFLGIAPLIPLRSSWIPRLRFRLSSFESLSTVSEEWLKLLRRQSSLQHLVFGDSFHGDIPTSQELPLLQTIFAPGPVITQFAKHLRFQHVRFDYDRYLASWSLLPSEALDFSSSSSKITTIRISAPDLLKLLTHGAQGVLSPLEHVVLEEDRSWTDHLYTNTTLLTTLLGTVVAKLDSSFPQLKSLVLFEHGMLRTGTPDLSFLHDEEQGFMVFTTIARAASFLSALSAAATTTMKTLDLDLIFEVARWGGHPEMVAVLRLSRATYFAFRCMLYRKIVVSGRAAKKVVQTLAHRPQLQPMVECLYFGVDSAVNLEQWGVVFPGLVNLTVLEISTLIHLPRSLIPHITCRLEHFTSNGSVSATWAEFLSTQHTLSSIFVDIDFVGPFPSPQQIPKLQSVKARPADIPQFTPHALQDLWFFTDGIHSVSTLRAADLVKFATSPALLVVIRISAPQLIQLLEAAPRILRNLRHIVLDEDPSWSRFTFEQGQAPSSAVLKRLSILLGIGGRLRCLRSLLLVCAQKRLRDDYRPILRRSQGPLFARYIRLYCTAPQLRVLNFFAFDGYARWTRWRESAEVMVYQDIDLDDHWPPADLEEPQISTIVENKRPRRPLLAFKTVRSLWTPGTSADGAARAIRPIAPIIIIRAETRRRRVRSAPTPTPKDKLGTLATPEAEEAWCAAFESLRKTLLEKKSVNDATVISEATQEPISGADFVAGSSGKGKVID